MHQQGSAMSVRRHVPGGVVRPVVKNGPVDGGTYREKLIADRLGAGRGQPAAGRRSSLNLAEIRGVALDLVAAGVLGQQAMERIIADLERTLEGMSWLTVVQRTTTGADGGPSIDPGMMARVGEARPQWQEAILDPPAPVLRKVISLAGQTLTWAGGSSVRQSAASMDERPVALIGVDVWSTMVTLRLAHHDSDGRTHPGAKQASIHGASAQPFSAAEW
jgi:hypothetical protein